VGETKTPESDSSLDQLINAILDDEGYARGLRKSQRKLSETEALSVLEEFYRVHDLADEKIPQVAEKLGRKLACEVGCSACCASVVLVSTPEARLIARALLEPESSAILERFRARAAEWAEVAGEMVTRAADAHAAGTNERYVRLMKEHGRLGIPCPLNTDGVCEVYAVRPLPCRQVWVADTAAYCMSSGDPDQPKAELITFDAFEEMLQQGRTLTAGMQHVLGEGIRRMPLPLAVLPLLEKKP